MSSLTSLTLAEARDGLAAKKFSALELTPPKAVKVVLLGQDPYPTAGNANGLAFSVTKDVQPR